jgi:hypothetical protein
MKKFLTLLFITSSIIGFSQNCGSISNWSYTGSISGANTTYNISFDALSTSGGGKSVTDLIIACGGTTVNTNTTCYVTAPATGTPINYTYSFTVPTCGSALTLSYNGWSNGACGGSNCFVNVSAGTPASIPVTWLSTKATCLSATTEVTWSTASEHNNSGFEIQRQNSEGVWKTIANRTGKGNTNTISEYTEYVPYSNGVFRIKQVDYDGTTDHSIVFKSECEKQKIKVYPNPASDGMNFSEEVSNVKITNVLGSVVFSSSEPMTKLKRPNGLPSGLYIISYQFENTILTKRIKFN